ncbi:MAG TPA: (2Fe-2S)-binding protein [Bosea sp. (in: a-proteobacteria)]|nr:(2Fe-2S)-binding protein [Bosea sp. (in: a-proteobacteria)]
MRRALAAQAALSPDVSAEFAGLEPGWITAENFFRDSGAIEKFLDYEGSFNPGTDRKACAAFLITDYAFIFSLASVPVFASSGILPDCSPERMALQFYQRRQEHDGHAHEVRRAHVRYLSPAFSTRKGDAACHPDARGLFDQTAHCELFRRAIEDHFRPLIEVLWVRTKLARTALWRLVADAVAARFLEVGRQLGYLEEAKASAMAILKQPGSPLNNRQLHYFELSVLDRDQRAISYDFRSRGGCCRYYTVDGGKLCSTCVLKHPKERDAELRQAIGRHLGLPAGDAS